MGWHEFAGREIMRKLRTDWRRLQPLAQIAGKEIAPQTELLEIAPVGV